MEERRCWKTFARHRPRRIQIHAAKFEATWGKPILRVIYSSRLLHKVNAVKLGDGYCGSVVYLVCLCHARKSMCTALSVPLKGSLSVTERPLKMCYRAVSQRPHVWRNLCYGRLYISPNKAVGNDYKPRSVGGVRIRFHSRFICVGVDISIHVFLAGGRI